MHVCPRLRKSAFTLVELPVVSKRKREAFTLVELLVVIGIIALLISILLPTLGRARMAANTVKCAANLRSILQGMQIYASQNNGSIPGSAHTTARFVYVDPNNAIPAANSAFGDGNCPSICGIFDWASPIARVMGIKFEEGGSAAQRAERFKRMRDYSGFVCPENQFLATKFSGSPIDTGTGPMISYNTAIGFLVVRNSAVPVNDGASGVGRTVGRSAWNPPSGYNVKVTKVGNPARKIYIADGSRFSTTNITPDVDLSYAGSNGGAWGDQGAATRFSRSWDRGKAAGNSNNGGGTRDARIYAYRHGGRITPFGRGDAFRFNVGYFDGHVESLGDLQGADPYLWFPKGTELIVNTTQIDVDVRQKYFNNVDKTYIVP